MCSVVGCESWRRSAQRFKLPEDPDRRLEWVQFLFEVNGQRLKEKSWTDITICSEHFTRDCFETTTAGTLQLKPCVVPSVCIKSEAHEALEGSQYVEPKHEGNSTCVSPIDSEESKYILPVCIESDEALENPRHVTICGAVQLKPCVVPLVCIKSEADEALERSRHVKPAETICKREDESEESKYILPGSQPSLESSGVSASCVSNAVASGSHQTRQRKKKKKKAALAQMKGKFAVNERCLIQLFGRKCPSCKDKLQMEKVTYGALIVFNQQCLRCDYRFQWKSQVNASVPTEEDQTQQEMSTGDNPTRTVETVTFSDEESDTADVEEVDEGGVISEEWSPDEDVLFAEELAKESEEETGDDEKDLASPGGLQIYELCTECGRFFNVQKPHTCEHKVKPFSCNVCGKRCVTEISLKIHSKIHDETYEHPCKFCHVTFKARVDKLKHEQVHQNNNDPYKCPDCPETFTTSKKRNLHLSNHRAEKEFKCGVCGIDFKDVHHLQRHSVVHTGLKPYKCSVCQRGFNQSNHLKSHMRLHTGERPYKCQHCDRSFNHNVSLKSHVLRYHSSSSGPKPKEKKIKERTSNGGDAVDNGNEEGTNSELDDVEEEQDTGEEVQKEKNKTPKSKKRRTGRPRGRPKRNAAGDTDLDGQQKSPRSKTKTRKSKVQKLKETSFSHEESEGEQSDSDSAEQEEEVEEKETARKSTGRGRGRPKNNSDTDFDPAEETKKKRYSSVKRRGRAKKNPPLNL